MRPLNDKQKKKLRKKISIAIEDGTFTIRNFAEQNSMSESTVRRLIRQDKKLSDEYAEYRIMQETERVMNHDAKAAAKAKSKAGASASANSGVSPFVEEVSKDFSDKKGTGVVTTRSLDIKTVAAALRVAEVDLDIWEVDRHLINSWEVTIGGKSSGTGKCETYTNFQVKIWLKRKTQELLALQELYEKIANRSFVVSKIAKKFYDDKKYTSNGEAWELKEHHRELEISLADIHLGLRCYAEDSDVSWSPKDAETMTMTVLEDLIRMADRFGPFERIVFPFGNDFLHSDNVFNTTTAGTHQPESDAWKNNMLRGEILAIAMIDRLKQVAPVKVISVPGNHAMHTEISMSRTLNAYYHNDENVEIDAGFSSYKFHLFGVNLIGFEHGHSIRQTMRLPGLMANECRLDGWQQARYCEWHCGDQHRKGAGRPSVMAEQGVSVEFLPSLVPANSWHKLHAFNWQKRIGMAFIWDKTHGPIARVQTNIDNYTNKILGSEEK